MTFQLVQSICATNKSNKKKKREKKKQQVEIETNGTILPLEALHEHSRLHSFGIQLSRIEAEESSQDNHEMSKIWISTIALDTCASTFCNSSAWQARNAVCDEQSQNATYRNEPAAARTTTCLAPTLKQ